MTGQEAIAYIHTYNWEKHEPGLHRIRQLLRALGDPHKGLKFVHVAGTNGKGSTCAMLASVLQEAGYRVGLNTSPYIMTFHERIRVNGEMIPDEALANLTERIRPIAEDMEEHPTEFELITALAMLYFKEQRCDIVVLEVGLGGALDASNVIDCPEVSVLTAMGMDHMGILGTTMAEIAAAKAGIVKEGGAVVSYGGCAEADAVFRSVCGERGAALREVDFVRLQRVEVSLDGAVFDFAPYQGLCLPLTGLYQTRNAATALTALEVLAAKGWNIPEDAVHRGLANVRWPARFEVLGKEPLFLLDGAHNAHGVRAAAESLSVLLPDRKVVMILGVLADKDVEEMMDRLAPLAERAFVIRPDSPRAMSAQTLCAMLRVRGVEAQECVCAEQAVEQALNAAGSGGAVCALGSLYLSGAVREAAGKLL
ncbi:MAG: bifunctional folylpolyglutamate synthase/dihydrofolate synthase [Ruminococcaceae bacterium]|nr:bifunctional folylpolyglutamate synthase/dihydrofolate synthase [Oscillospiraceae bacterium]